MNRPRMAPVAVLIEPLQSNSARAVVGVRGNHAVYRRGELNRCPSCGRSHWEIGRSTAECGFCHAALPIAQ